MNNCPILHNKIIDPLGHSLQSQRFRCFGLFFHFEAFWPSGIDSQIIYFLYLTVLLSDNLLLIFNRLIIFLINDQLSILQNQIIAWVTALSSLFRNSWG